jgi:hypothetical protein
LDEHKIPLIWSSLKHTSLLLSCPSCTTDPVLVDKKRALIWNPVFSVHTHGFTAWQHQGPSWAPPVFCAHIRCGALFALQWQNNICWGVLMQMLGAQVMGWSFHYQQCWLGWLHPSVYWMLT